MDESFLKSCSLFKGVPLDQLRSILAEVPQHILCYEKEETVFHFMEEAGLTQAALAEKLGITDCAVSKWENGKSMPDASIMLNLCKQLGISVNELLSRERLDMDDYRKMAEENLLQLKKQEELNNKKLLSLETVIGYFSTISFSECHRTFLPGICNRRDDGPDE